MLPKFNLRYKLLSHFEPMDITQISKIQLESSTFMQNNKTWCY